VNTLSMLMSENSNQQKNGAPMSPELRQYYLQTMGIQLWQQRLPADADTKPIQQPVPEKIEQSVAGQVEPELTDWISLDSAIQSCVACELHQSRVSTVAAEGSESARLMFITTAPIFDPASESALQTSQSGQLFSNMLKAIDLQRDEVFLTGLVKCQLADNRELRTTEILCCEHFLSQQINLLKPQLLVALGEVSAQHLLLTKKSIDELSTQSFHYQSVPLMVMHRPEELLKQPEKKRQAWHTLLQIKHILNG